ncbi:MAG: hypothetical protein NT033_06205 [Candidatus Omnitrophica bacterium]|nr:hypothetical protein [Candidatus Omnitrophota bacterium]
MVRLLKLCFLIVSIFVLTGCATILKKKSIDAVTGLVELRLRLISRIEIKLY